MPETEGFQLTPEDIDGCVGHLKMTVKAATAERYGKALEAFYAWLPEDKWVGENTLRRWVKSLAENYSPSYVNFLTSAGNALMRYKGYPGYWMDYSAAPERPRPEMTHEEYQRLLDTAKALGKKQAYLSIRLFACTGAQIPKLLALTVEDVRRGTVTAGTRTEPLPPDLRSELLDYALHNGIRRGPIFLGRGAEPVNGHTIRMQIKEIGKAAGIQEPKLRVRALQRLSVDGEAEHK